MKKNFDVAPVSGVDPEVGLLFASLQSSTRTWRQELGKVRPERIAWRPFPDGPSIGAVLLHMADVEAFWVHNFAAGLPRNPADSTRWLSDTTDQYGCNWPDPPAEPLDWYLAELSRVRTTTASLLPTLGPPERWLQMENGQRFTVRWILSHVIEHDAYHGGQLVLLKTMAGKGLGPPKVVSRKVKKPLDELA